MSPRPTRGRGGWAGPLAACAVFAALALWVLILVAVLAGL